MQLFAVVFCLLLILAPEAPQVNSNPLYNDTQDLLLQFSQGQEHAFSVIYDQFYDRVYGFAKRWIKDTDDIEDITADTFLKLWDKRHSFQTLDNIGGFLFTAVRNASFDYLRHLQTMKNKENEIRREIEESNERDFANMEVRAEFLKLIYAEVEKMPTKMKEIFLLSYRDGLKPAQIAEMLELHVQTVKNQKANAVKLLRLALGHQPLLLAFLLYLETQPSGVLLPA